MSIKPGLSIVYIVRDEEECLASSLNSVSFADEIIVADTGSTDGTVDLATSLGAKVISIDFDGFGTTKQRAIEHATHEWVLSIDADEIVTADLASSIRQVMKDGIHSGYSLIRHTWFLGKQIRHGGWGKNKIMRLFRNGSGKFTEDIVHEKIVVQGSTGILSGVLEHHSITNFADYLKKLDEYSTLGAKKLLEKNKRNVGITQGIFDGIRVFLRMYILKAGWLDGAHGAVLAVSSGYARFLRQAKAVLIKQGIKDI